MRIALLLFLFPAVIKAQTYRCGQVFLELDNTYKLIDTLAYLDYNLAEHYVELVTKDTVRHYRMKKRMEYEDEHRFVVNFKNTTDNMLWNVKKEGEYFFSFTIKDSYYWFRNLKGCTRGEINTYKKSFNKE